MSSLGRHNRQPDFGNGQDNPSCLKAFHPSLAILLLPNRRFVTSVGVTFCVLHRTFASRCGCCNGLKAAKLVTKIPKLPLVRCHRCFSLTDSLIPFAVPWSVAFVKGATDLLCKGVCGDCYGDLVRKTARAFCRYRFPFLSVRPVPIWRLPALSSLSLSVLQKGRSLSG